MYINTCTYMYVHMYMYMYIYIHMYVYRMPFLHISLLTAIFMYNSRPTP